MQRIRKYQTTLPETILPPPNTAAAGANANAPRMGTPAADAGSWTGWAISSFTNKLASASGQIQPVTNGSSAPPPEQRSASVPPRPSTEARPAIGRTLTPSAAPSVPSGLALSSRPSTSSNPFSADDEAEAEDFSAAWGDDGDDDPWGEPAAIKAATTAASTLAAAFDDSASGEPDFAGWLNAQAAAKSASKKPLPKGLAKSTTTKPKTTASIGARKNVIGGTSGAAASAAARKAAEVKKPPEKPKQEEDDGGWGDAWE